MRMDNGNVETLMHLRSCVNFHNDDGSDPPNLFCPRRNSTSLNRSPTALLNCPLKLLLSKRKFVMSILLNNDSGIVPSNMF